MARLTLLMDSAPTKESIKRYSIHLTHVLAELEQVDTERRAKPKAKNEPKIRKAEEEGKGDKKVKELKEEEGGSGGSRPARPCKFFFFTDQGCRKGKS